MSDIKDTLKEALSVRRNGNGIISESKEEITERLPQHRPAAKKPLSQIGTKGSIDLSKPTPIPTKKKVDSPKPESEKKVNEGKDDSKKSKKSAYTKAERDAIATSLGLVKVGKKWRSPNYKARLADRDGKVNEDTEHAGYYVMSHDGDYSGSVGYYSKREDAEKHAKQGNYRGGVNLTVVPDKKKRKPVKVNEDVKDREGITEAGRAQAFHVKDGKDNYKIVGRGAAVPRNHSGWQSVKHKGKRYQLHGGERTEYFINIANPLKSKKEKGTQVSESESSKKFKKGDRVRMKSAGMWTPVGTVDGYHPDHDDGVMVKWDISGEKHQSQPSVHPEHNLR